MYATRPIDPSTALSSFPVTREVRGNNASSKSSMSTGRGSTKTSSLSISETFQKVYCENPIISERLTTQSFEQTRAEDLSQDGAIRRHRSSDLLKAKIDRESVVNLAKFLRTTTPPPSSYTSLPDTGRRHFQDKKLPFKMLRRHSSKKPSGPVTKTLQLPDSAVAAKTSKGHWHIAISIPVECQDQESDRPPPYQFIKHAKTQSEAAIGNGPITVPKPLLGNVRPAAIDIERVHVKSRSHEDLHRPFASPEPMPVPPVSGIKAVNSSEAPNGQRCTQGEPPKSSVADVTSIKSASQENAVLIGNEVRPESQRSNARKSEDTSSTTRSLHSSVCHTRGQSSVSTAPSVGYPASPRAGLAHKSLPSVSSILLGDSEESIPPQLPHFPLDTRSDDLFRPTSVGSDMSSANLDVAATAQGYGPDMPGTQVVFVRKGTQIPNYRARFARRTPRNSSAEYILSLQSSLSCDPPTAASNGADNGGTTQYRQSRRERVKAIRSRDMAKSRAAKKYQQVMASVTAQETPITPSSQMIRGQQAETCRRQLQKRSLSYASIAEETAWQKTLNSVVPIVVAADIAPSDVHVNPMTRMADLKPLPAAPERRVPTSRFSTQLRHDKGQTSMRNSPVEVQTPPHSISASPMSSDREEMSPTNSCEEAHTPPRSATPSPVPSDTEGLRSLKTRAKTINPSKSQKHSHVGNRQTDFRPQKSIHDDSTDIRMNRLETINAAIFRTLNAVVEMGEGFRELRQLLPAESAGPQDAPSREEYKRRYDEDHDPVGSLIRELRGAVKIGQQELAKYGAAV